MGNKITSCASAEKGSKAQRKDEQYKPKDAVPVVDADAPAVDLEAAVKIEEGEEKTEVTAQSEEKVETTEDKKEEDSGKPAAPAEEAKEVTEEKEPAKEKEEEESSEKKDEPAAELAAVDSDVKVEVTAAPPVECQEKVDEKEEITSTAEEVKEMEEDETPTDVNDTAVVTNGDLGAEVEEALAEKAARDEAEAAVGVASSGDRPASPAVMMNGDVSSPSATSPTSRIPKLIKAKGDGIKAASGSEGEGEAVAATS